jgi:hypothetical protein
MLMLFDYITNLNLTPNEFYTLLSIYHKQIPKIPNLQYELKKLESTGYIQDSKLTNKAVEVVEKFEATFKSSAGKVTRNVKLSDDELERVKEYREVFPKGMLPSGYPSRVPVKELEKKFLWFHLNYDYDWDTIIKAAKKYVSEYESQSYKYMKTSGYFIAKTEKNIVISTLASYCDMIKEGDDHIPTSVETHKVL